MQTIEIKINRYIKHIDKNDLILDNGSCIQVLTQTGSRGLYGYAPLIMSKRLFKELKNLQFIFVDKEKTESTNSDKFCLTYYRFDIDRMIQMGYPVVNDKGGDFDDV